MQTVTALDAHGAIPEEERTLPGRRETYAELGIWNASPAA